MIQFHRKLQQNSPFIPSTVNGRTNDCESHWLWSCLGLWAQRSMCYPKSLEILTLINWSCLLLHIRPLPIGCQNTLHNVFSFQVHLGPSFHESASLSCVITWAGVVLGVSPGIWRSRGGGGLWNLVAWWWLCWGRVSRRQCHIPGSLKQLQFLNKNFTLKLSQGKCGW